MSHALPHYLLLCEAGAPDGNDLQWRFVLQAIESDESVTAADVEAVHDAERLELLSVVRGLEALGHPAKVTLITRSRYVQNGLARGLQEWRTSGWQWERFGRIVPVRDADLWQRVDRALEFHEVDCRLWRLDAATSATPVAGQERRSGEVPPPHFLRRSRQRRVQLNQVASADAVQARAAEGVPSTSAMAHRRRTERRRRSALAAARATLRHAVEQVARSSFASPLST